jgi:hypothetical protein
MAPETTVAAPNSVAMAPNGGIGGANTKFHCGNGDILVSAVAATSGRDGN